MKETENEVNKIKDLLKENLTTENLELSQQIDSSLDKILEQTNAQDEKLNKANETLLNLVKNTGFKVSESEDPLKEDVALSPEEASKIAYQRVLESRKNQ